MGRTLIQETNLQNIAAAIRAKNGGSSTYKPREMADAIRALPPSSTLVPKAITQNGSYSPQSENADGFSSVTVNVGRNLVRKDITRNGSFSAASDHVDGYSSVSVNVPNSYSALDEGKVVSSGTLTPQTSLSVTQNGTFDTTRNNQVTVNVSGASNTLVPKTITENGTYLPADDNADGFNWVNVAVPGGFEASDEGKVVQNGALIPQSSLSVTQNGTYDTTTKNSVVVSVSGGSNIVILSGTQAPQDSQGNNGNLYFQYTQVDFTCDHEYIVTDTSQRLAIHSASFYKIVEGPAIAVHWRTPDGRYLGPVLISTVADYTKHTMNESIVASATINGATWYLCGGNYWNSSSGDPTTPTMYNTGLDVNNDSEAVIRAILTAANAGPGEMKWVKEVFAKVNGEWKTVKHFNLADIGGLS